MSKFNTGGLVSVGGEGLNLTDKVVRINRCATVVKGGKRFSFSAMVVVGDGNGVVGQGFGKANEVPPAVEKAIKDAKKHLFKIPLRGQTLPHESRGQFGASIVQVLPAAPGTGVIAGDAVRAVMEAAGVKDVLTKVYGSTNPVNVVKAALDALGRMRTVTEVERLRGVKIA
ncbi:MAG: 30S ribosomal protein S5 [Planctomycetaceae bacterium]|nr:30S ribosomal protein S5 [Planctomycetota bacterium]NUN51893.1 30S ribosomal protein S5 [Planctomycetaceae bacterium]